MMTYTQIAVGGKVAVVIGGTSGIGRAIAPGLAEAGADVIATSRRVERVEATAREIEQRGRRTLRITSDVNVRSSLQKLLDASVETFSKVDVLVNSAGRSKRAPTLDFPESDWNAIMETILMVAALTKTLAIEWARYGVCVNAIMPGVIRTALNEQLLDGTPRGKEFLLRTPMQRLGKAEEIAGAAVFLASEAAGFVTGEILRVDGGMLASGVNQ